MAQRISLIHGLLALLSSPNNPPPLSAEDMENILRRFRPRFKTMWKHEKRTTDRRNRVRQKRDEVPFEEPWSFEVFWAAFLANGGVEEISGNQCEELESCLVSEW